MLDSSFWKGRRVFLTGHTGFKGSWMSLWLHALGADVTGFALEPPTRPNLFEQASVHTVIRSVRGDIRNFNDLASAVATCRPEIVIHMAAQSVVRKSYDDPIGTYSANVMGTVHLFEAIRQLHQPCVVVNVTSDKCYENREWLWGYREEEPMGGHDPYSNSKGCAELVTSAYRASFFPVEELDRHQVAVASARAGNAIGGGDWTADQLIPDLMRAFLDGRPCAIRNPLAVRPWQFVLEPIHGYLLLAQRLVESPAKFASSWNFGPAEADTKPVDWISDQLVHAWGEPAAWTQDTGQHPHEAHLLKLDASRARALLGWRPLLPLPSALRWIVDWYRGFQKGANLQLLTQRQIAEFDALSRE